MSLINFTNLDFDQIKKTLKDYLRSNSNFTDYDFEGSNLSILIDTLAYNTYLVSYNANMVSNEVFIDSATLRENVVSLARNIGYVPRSRICSRSNINFFVDTAQFSTRPVTLTLKKGTVCTSSSFDKKNYTFAIPNDITVPVVNGYAIFENIDIYEGFFTTQNFIVNYETNPFQRYILSNPHIDSTTIKVEVRNSQSSTITRKFIWSNDLFDVNPNSKIFFLQEVEDERYELIFGDGVFGKKLDNLNYILVSYIITNGEIANGISEFTYNGRIVDNNGRVINSGISLITTNISSRGGKEIEGIDSIKKYSTKTYAAQNRAVTSSDYETLIPQIYPETESVSVFGGEDLNPPRYGRVYISIKPFNGPFVPNYVKDNIKKLLKKYSIAGIVPEILDLKYLYIEVDSTIYYNNNFISDPDQLKAIVTDVAYNFSKQSDINRYGARFKYSKFLKLLDESNISITSNITKIIIRRDLKPALNSYADYEICYGNEFYNGNSEGFNIKSSGFTISGMSDVLYLTDIPDEIGDHGKIIFFKLDNITNYNIVNSNAGKINYKKGEIILSPVSITNTVKKSGEDNIIEISAIPRSNDIIGLQDLYLQLDISNSQFNVVADDISSGSDTSGTTFVVTSSYTNSDLTRR